MTDDRARVEGERERIAQIICRTQSGSWATGNRGITGAPCPSWEGYTPEELNSKWYHSADAVLSARTSEPSARGHTERFGWLQGTPEPSTRVVQQLEICADQLEQIHAPHLRPFVPGALAIQCEVKAKNAREALAALATPRPPSAAVLAERVEKLVEAARKAFFNLIADADRWDEDVDGDADEHGRPVITINYHLTVGHSQLEELCNALGVVKGRWEESLKDRIDRAIDEDVEIAIRARSISEEG